MKVRWYASATYRGYVQYSSLPEHLFLRPHQEASPAPPVQPLGNTFSYQTILYLKNSREVEKGT